MSGCVTTTASLAASGSRTTASVALSSTTCGPRADSGCGVAAPPTTWCSFARGRTARRRSGDAAGVPSCWPGSPRQSGSQNDPNPRDSVKGCLGLLVGVRGAVPMQQLLDRPGERVQETTGGLGLVWFGLLSIGAYLRRRIDRRRAKEARLGRVRVPAGRHQGGALSAYNAHWAGTDRDRHLKRVGPAMNRPSPPARRPANRPPGLPYERRIRQLGHASSNGAVTPVRPSVARDRDPIPAQLRFSILQRDGFRCRYCGRTSREPGVVLHVDHVVPLVAGGATSEDNLMTACSGGNLGKSTRPVVSAGS
jgi:5-methylcytosine-specific restriction endonuclease McrA